MFDSASNFCTFTRPIYYTDYHKPRFSLSQPLVYGVGSTVTLLDRLKAEDVLDGDLTDKMRLTLVNLSVGTEGDYRIRVQVTNSAGDTSMLSLTVMIRNRTARHPVITLSDYLVYATGDETPEDYRSLITSVLQSEHGRASTVEGRDLREDRPRAIRAAMTCSSPIRTTPVWRAPSF